LFYFIMGRWLTKKLVQSRKLDLMIGSTAIWDRPLQMKVLYRVPNETYTFQRSPLANGGT